jgi:uncharacterized SAM-binding protein YcdF (DUF218 family)
MSIEVNKINSMYGYLSAPDGPMDGDGAFVFGRKDLLLVDSLKNVMVPEEKVGYALITGGVGKDSGDLALPAVQLSEAAYLSVHAEAAGIPFGKLLVEQKAKNGGENARLGIAMIEVDERKLAHDSLLVISHATSLRRLKATLELEATRAGFQVNRYSSIPTNYPFNAENPADQIEAVQEILRIANWPAKGWLQIQEDLPAELVEYAEEAEKDLITK